MGARLSIDADSNGTDPAEVGNGNGNGNGHYRVTIRLDHAERDGFTECVL